MTDETLERRKQFIPQAKEIITEVEHDFNQWLETRKFAPTIKALKKKLKTMKDDVVFVNTSRGDNIDEEALIKELEKGRLFAFLDVTSPEPSPADSPLRKLPNVALTPHIAGAKSYRTGAMAVEEICRYFAGEPAIHRVTKDMLPTIA